VQRASGAVAGAVAGAAGDSPRVKPETGWLQRDTEMQKRIAGDRPTTDATADFQKNLSAKKLPANAKDYAYVIDPGFLGDQLQKVPGGYMKENRDALKAQGLDAELAPTKGVASEKDNLETLAKFVNDTYDRTGKKVVLIGHSFGGARVRDLLMVHPELESKVGGIVALNAAAAGTVLADDVKQSGPLSKLAGKVMNGLGGDSQPITDLTYESRQKFLQQNARPLPKDLPFVSVATSRAPDPGSLLAANIAGMKAKHGLDNDGAIPQQDQVWPGSRVIYLDGRKHAGVYSRSADHADLGLHGPGNHYAPGDATVAAVATLLQGK
jgi:pimeloyl-ACP methyl ester carboxylesterase